MMQPILRVRELAVQLGLAEALTNVNLSVPPGSCLGIVGETGSGKTMTCRTLLGLERRIGGRVIRGRITFKDRDLTGLTEQQWRRIRGREIALIPQASLSGMDPLMRVGPQLQETIRAHDSDAEPRRRALELLEQVQMPDPRATIRLYPHELSGGMRQRAMIALALSGRPSLLVADEPTTALDVTVQRRILRLLHTIRAESSMSMIFVSHDLTVVKSISDYVTIMYSGITVETGPSADVLERPAHPYTRALIEAQPGLVTHRKRLTAIDGAPPALGARPAGCPFQPRCPLALERCETEMPPSELVQPGHTAACWRAERVAA
jgi:oligopeptide/dipeptide ABC transporter ATP-binding protein